MQARDLEHPRNRGLHLNKLHACIHCRYEPANAGRPPCNSHRQAAGQCQPCPSHAKSEGATPFLHHRGHCSDITPMLPSTSWEPLIENEGTLSEGQRNASHYGANELHGNSDATNAQQNSRLPGLRLSSFSYPCKWQQLAQKQHTQTQERGILLSTAPWSRSCYRSTDRGKCKQGKQHGGQRTLHQDRKGSPPGMAMQVWPHQLVVDACMPPMRRRPYGQSDPHAQPTSSAQWCTDWSRTASATKGCSTRWLNGNKCRDQCCGPDSCSGTMAKLGPGSTETDSCGTDRPAAGRQQHASATSEHTLTTMALGRSARDQIPASHQHQQQQRRCRHHSSRLRRTRRRRAARLPKCQTKRRTSSSAS